MNDFLKKIVENPTKKSLGELEEERTRLKHILINKNVLTNRQIAHDRKIYSISSDVKQYLQLILKHWNKTTNKEIIDLKNEILRKIEDNLSLLSVLCWPFF